MTLVKRTVKGGPLTHQEGDGNWDHVVNRANHEGTQAISTVTGLQAALDGKAASAHTHGPSQITSGAAPAGHILTADGAGGTAFGAPPAGGGSGNVVKDGTPVANRMTYWTGDGTAGHKAGFTFDPSTDTMSVVRVTLGSVTIDGQSQLPNPSVAGVFGSDGVNPPLWLTLGANLKLVGGALAFGGNPHKLIYLDGSGNPVELAFGTAGQVLTSNGANLAPSMQTPAAGGGGGSLTAAVLAKMPLTPAIVFEPNGEVFDVYSNMAGTLYTLISASATANEATIMAGNSDALTAATWTDLSARLPAPGTVGYLHAHFVASNGHGGNPISGLVADRAAEVPAAFGDAQWSLADAGTGAVLNVTISSLPANNGDAITDIEYRINSGSAVSAGTTSSFQITSGLTQDVSANIEIRAVNSVGVGPWSSVKSATPTLVTPSLSMRVFDVQQDNLGVGGFNSTCILTIPSGVQSGDLMVAVFPIAANGNDRTISSAPSGWTLVASGNAGTSGDGFWVYTKVAGAGEPGNTYTWTLNASAGCVFGFAAVAGGATISVTFGDTIDPPAHTPGGGSADTVWMAFAKYHNQLATAQAAPSGYTGLGFAQTWTGTGNNEVRMGGAYKQATAASEDPGTFTWSATASFPQSVTIAVRG